MLCCPTWHHHCFRSVLFDHLSKHYQGLQDLSNKYGPKKNTLRTNTGHLLSKFLLTQMRNKQLSKSLRPFKTKDKKLRNLFQRTRQIELSIRFL